MGAEEVPAEPKRPATAVIALLALAGLLVFAGCGSDAANDEADQGALIGPLQPAGDVSATPATLRADQGFTSLGVAQIRSRGPNNALILAQIKLLDEGQPPRFRLLVDGEPQRDAEVNIVRNGGERAAVVSCGCRLSTGDHDIAFEGTAESGSTRIGARSLIVFAEVDFEGEASAAILGSELATGAMPVPPEGTVLASMRPREADRPMLILAGVRSPLGETAAEGVRLELFVGEEQAQELAVTKIPAGKLVAYLDADGADVGEEVSLQGYVSDGQGEISVATLAACACGVTVE